MKSRRRVAFVLILWLVGLRCSVAAAADSSVPVAAAPTAIERAYELDAGKAAPRNAAAAATLYAEAAAAGDAVAHLRLGYFYEVGDGVPQDYAVARTHYQAAAEAGLSDGHLHLAICYLEGWGGPADRGAFVREIQTAADANNVAAERILGALYITGFGVPRDQTAATQWLDRAARHGDADAAVALGQRAETEQIRHLMHDETLARSWYQLSAENEYADGMRALARTFLTGPKEDRNWALGHRWLEMATDNGDAEAPYILAVFEMIGVDAPARDEAKALAWLKTAGDRGNEKATEVLQLHEGGRPLDAAFRYMLQVPFDDRYVQRQAAQRSNAPTHPPSLYRIVKPVYPYSLRLTGTQGKVLVDFVVDTTGRVQMAKAIESPHPLFSERAVRAVEQWRFYPGQKDGRVVNTHMRVPVIFDLEEESLGGVDTLLASAHDAAERLGGEAQADSDNLQIARPLAKLPLPTGPDGQVLKNVTAMLLLVVDASGTPIRGHILHSNPPEAGAQILQIALQTRYIPRMEGVETVLSHQVLIFNTLSKETDRALR